MEEQSTFTVKEDLFINEYLKDFNASRAARDAGYSKTTARAIGHENLTKPNIKAEIQKRLSELSLTKEATKKLITDIATANVSNYFKPVKVVRSKKIKKSLEALILRLRDEIEFEDEYALQVNLKAKELEDHMKSQEAKRRRIIRYKIELKNNPDAFRIVDSEPELVDDVELDLVALTADKEGGRIKSFKYGRFGLEVDLLPADAALTNIARIHGLFKDNVEVSMKGSVSPDKWLEQNSDGKAAD